MDIKVNGCNFNRYTIFLNFIITSYYFIPLRELHEFGFYGIELIDMLLKFT